MGKMDALLGKVFRSSKCKTMLKLTVARIKILSNKKELQCKQLRKDIAQLLQNNQEASARIRVEHYFREKNTLDAYLLIGGYCEAVSERIKFIKTQKTCPNDLKESIASLVFAAPRCADLPELQDVRSLFAAKYGKEFTESAVELRAGCGVNKQIIEKLSTRVPSSEVKLRLLKEIASEHGIKFNFEEVAVEELKPTKVQYGSKQNFETTQTTLKPQDVTLEPAKIPSMSSKAPDNVRQQASGTNGKQDTHSSAEQRPEGLPSPDIYNSNSSLDPSNIKMDSVASRISATDIDLNISENDLYARQGKDGSMDFHKSTKNTDAYQNIPISDTNHGVTAGRKQENAKYRDVATAAQAAFESAAYAAVAARAAVELAKNELWNKMSNESVNDPIEAISESEDGLVEALPRKRSGGKFRASPGGRSGTEGTFSTRNDQAFDIRSPQKRNGSNDVFHTVSGVMETQYSGREVSDSESGEELEDQDFRSKNRSHVQKSSQKHLSNYSDDEKEFETDSLHKDGKLNDEQMHKGMNEPQLKRSMTASTSSSSKKSLSPKSSHPLFDDYSDGEDEKNPTSRYSDQSILIVKNSETEDTHLGNTQFANNQRQLHRFDESDDYKKGITRKESTNQGFIHETSGPPSKTSFSPKTSHPLFDDYSDGEDEKYPIGRYSDQNILTAKYSGTEDPNNQRQLYCHDESDEYEKGIARKESKNQNFTHETSGPPKLSYGDLLQKEKYSFNYFELHSENEMEMLNDDNLKFQGQRKSSKLNFQASGNYKSPTGIPAKNRIATVSADESTYPGYMGNNEEFQPHHGNKNQYFEKQDSDDEGVYRYKGDGKLSWQPVNTEKQHSSVASRKSHNVNTRLSVRTRR